MALRVPDVPTYSPKVLPESVPVSPYANIGAQTADLVATTELFGTAAKLGTTMLGIEQENLMRIRKDQQDLDLVKRSNAATLEKQKIINDKNTQFDGVNQDRIVKESTDELQKIDQRWLDGVSPYIAQEYQKQAARTNTALLSEHARHGILSQRKAGETTVAETVDLFSKQALASTVIPVGYYISELQDRIDMIPGFNVAEKAAMKKSQTERLVESVFFGKLANPETAPGFLRELQSPGVKEKWFELLDPDKRKTYEDALKSHQTMTEISRLETYLDTTFNISGQSEGPRNFESALKELAKPGLAIDGNVIRWDIRQKMIDSVKEMRDIGRLEQKIDIQKKVDSVLSTSAKLQTESGGASSAIKYLRAKINSPDTPAEVSIAADKEIGRIKQELRLDAQLNIMSSAHKDAEAMKRALGSAAAAVKPEVIPNLQSMFADIRAKNPTWTWDQVRSSIANDPQYAKKTKGLQLKPSAAITANPVQPTEKTRKDTNGNTWVLRNNKWEMVSKGDAK